MTMIIVPPTGGGGGGSGVAIYQNIADLPVSAPDGTVASVIEDQTLRQFDSNTNQWVIVGGPGVVFTGTDTNSIDVTVSSNVISADLKISSELSDPTYLPIPIIVETDGVRAQVSEVDIKNLFSAGDTNSIDMGYSDGEFSADVNLSGDGASASNQLVTLTIHSDGLHAEIPDASITGLISVSDTNSIDMTYTSGAISADLKLSATAVAGTDLQLNLLIDSNGLYGGVAIADILLLLSATAPITYDDITGVFAIPPATTSDAGYLTATDWNTFNGKQQAITIGALGAGDANGLVLTTGSLVLHAATATQPGAVSATTQSFAGDKTFLGSITRNNNTTNASFVSGITASSAGASAGNGQTATATFDSDSLLFVIEVGTERQSLLVHTSYASDLISFVSDLGALGLISDAGAGIYVSKSASSNTVSIKNRMGGSRTIRVRAIGADISSATAWT